jgi:hypothetical protein
VPHSDFDLDIQASMSTRKPRSQHRRLNVEIEAEIFGPSGWRLNEFDALPGKLFNTNVMQDFHAIRRGKDRLLQDCEDREILTFSDSDRTS